MNEIEELVDKILRNENLTTSRETCTADIFPPQNRKFHMPSMGLKSGLHHDRPTTKHLSHDMRNYGGAFVFNGKSLNNFREKRSDCSEIEEGMQAH